MATNSYLPLSSTEAAARQVIGDAADSLTKLGTDPNFLKCLQPATQQFFVKGDPAAVKASVPTGNIKACAAQVYDILVQSQADLEAVRKVAQPTAIPVIDTYLTAIVQAFTALQGEAPKFQLQEAERAMALLCVTLADKVGDGIGQIYDPNLTTKQVKQQLTAVKAHLTGIADALGGTRLMANVFNVPGTCAEIVQLAYNVVGGLSASTIKSDIQLLITQVQAANANYLGICQQIAKQPIQTFITLQNVGGTFAQKTIRNYTSCQESIDAMNQAAQEGQQAYAGLEVWIYQFLRPQTPTKAIRQSVNVGFTAGTTPDPLVPEIKPTNLEADHIISMKIMSQNPNWQYLEMADKLDILNNVSNFVGIGKSVNTSKGEKTYADWLVFLQLDTSNVVTAKSALKGKTVDIAMLNSYIARETTLRPVIDADIDARMRAREQGLIAKYEDM